MIAFAIKAPLVPLHTWLPDAAEQATPGTSVLLIGVLDKIGTYGMIALVLPLFPEAAAWAAPVVLVLAVVGIIYGGLAAIGQDSLYRLISYTSISHFGFMVLGIFIGDRIAAIGAMVYMVAHGLSIAGLYLVTGFLARRTGADVIGIAGPSSAQALRDLGIQPVEYGEGLAERLREAAPRIDAFIDCFGHGYVETALDLGVAPERVATIVDFGTAQRFGVPVVVGTSAAMDPTAVVSRIARLIAAGELSLPIRAVYPFDEVRAAYDDLATRHGVGKIVLSVG